MSSPGPRVPPASTTGRSSAASPPPRVTQAPAETPVEPMQLGRTHLTPTERQRRVKEGSCIYYGKLAIVFLYINFHHLLSRKRPSSAATGRVLVSPIVVCNSLSPYAGCDSLFLIPRHIFQAVANSRVQRPCHVPRRKTFLTCPTFPSVTMT